MPALRRTASALSILVVASCGSNGPATLLDGPKKLDAAVVDGRASTEGSLTDLKPAAERKATSDGKLTVDRLRPDGKVVPDGKVSTDVTPPGCGDGVRTGLEECDDGNLVNLDGCDASCHFEQNLRVVKLVWQTGTDAVCTKNAIGGAIMSVALTQIQPAIDQAIQDGSISLLLRLLDLSDLSGGNDPSFSVGFMSGTAAVGTGYNGSADLDWWYTAKSTFLDAKRLPLDQLPASIASSQLSIGPGTIAFPFNLGSGTTTNVQLTGVLWQVPVDAASAPLSSTGTPPGHLASEHLGPTLKSFASAGSTNNGHLCGSITAASLQGIAIPSQLLGTFSCSQGYTAQNSLLDMLVGGCTLVVIPVIGPTQPDGVDPAAPTIGAGPPYTLSTDPTSKKVTGCKDKSGATVNLASCLDASAYSVFFKVALDRVIIK